MYVDYVEQKGMQNSKMTIEVEVQLGNDKRFIPRIQILDKSKSIKMPADSLTPSRRRKVSSEKL